MPRRYVSRKMRDGTAKGRPLPRDRREGRTFTERTGQQFDVTFDGGELLDARATPEGDSRKPGRLHGTKGAV